MTTKAQVLEALDEVEDPELELSIVELGLVYDVRFEDKDGFSLDEVAIDMAVEPTPIKLFDPVPKTTTVEDALKMPETESVETPISERIKPDLTEVIEPESSNAQTGMLNQRIVTKKGKVVEPPKSIKTNNPYVQLSLIHISEPTRPY